MGWTDARRFEINNNVIGRGNKKLFNPDIMTRVLTRAVFDLLSRQKRAPIAALLIGIIALFPRRRPSRREEEEEEEVESTVRMNNRIGLIHIYRDQKLGDYRKVIFIDRILLSVDKGIPFFSIGRHRFKDRCSSPWGASIEWKKDAPIGCLLVETLYRRFFLVLYSSFVYLLFIFFFFSNHRFIPWTRNCRGTL